MEQTELQVLIIDSSQDDVALISGCLDDYSSPVSLSHVLTAEEAIQKFKTHKYDICIVDLFLHGIGGLDFLRHILDHGNNLPTLVITGEGNEKMAARAIKLGAYEYLLKDEIDSALLNKTIYHAIESHQSIKEKERLREELKVYTRQLENEVLERSLVEKALEEVNDELESRVKKRTAEFQKANEELKKEVVERKRVEEELRKLSRAVQQSPASIVITNTKGIIEYVNPKFTEITGFSYEEAIGQNPKMLKSGEQSDQFYKDFWETITSGKEWRGEFYNRKKNGEFFWEEALISPIVNEKGEITNFLGIKEDITEHKRLTQALQHKQRLVEMGEMSAQIAHEIRNPMNSISMAYECLEESLSSDKESREVFKILGKGIDNLISISTGLLDYGKSGQINKSSLDCLTLIDNVLSSLDKKAKTNGIKIIKKIPKKCISLNADEVKIRQILINVVDNAIESMVEEGTLTLSLTEDEGKVMISVSDTGNGIDSDNLEKIFLPFYTTKKRGTGLGMAIVKHFIELHDGDVSIESEVGSGTTVKINLPL